MINTKEKERRLRVIRGGAKKKAKSIEHQQEYGTQRKKSSKNCKTC